MLFFESLNQNMILEENTIFKTNDKKLLNFLLRVLDDDTQVTQDISIGNESCLSIVDDIILRMNESVYFSQDAPDDSIVEVWECCKIKLYEIGSLIQENNDSIGRVTDDLKMSRFLIDCNMEEDIFEL